MDSLKIQKLTNTLEKKVAIISHSNDNEVQTITYKLIYELAHDIKQFLSTEIKFDAFTTTGRCIGLLMDKNLLIPSILIAFQELGICVTFVSMDKDFSDIEWLLSVDYALNNPSFSFSNELKIFDREMKLWKNEDYPSKKHLEFNGMFCAMHTSGSTGEPKQIFIPYSCIEQNAWSLNKHFQLTSNDTIYWGTPLTFDPNLIELILGIGLKATVIIVTKAIASNSEKLYRTLFENNATTFLQMVPSLFCTWNKQIISDVLMKSSLKILAFGGEAFPKEILSLERKSSLRLLNLYGITELSCWASIADVSEYQADTEIPLGKSLDETFIELVDKHGENIQNGVGEICVGSYTRFCSIDKLTSDHHLPYVVKTGDLGERKQDTLFYRGRKTRMIKRFGHRIFLDKAENLISTETGLRSRIIYSDKKLLIFVLIDDYFEKTRKTKLLDKLRVKLLNILPEHSYPDFLDIVAHFPLNTHGKICDKFLLDLYQISSSTLTSEASGRKILEKVLKFYLQIHLPSFNDLNQHTFFELGGNSILAIQVSRAFEDETGSNTSGVLITHLINDSIKTCLDYVSKNFNNKRKNPKQNGNSRKNPRIPILENLLEDIVSWKYDLKGCVDSAPLTFTRRGENYVAVGSFAQIFAVILESGKELLRTTLPKEVAGQPVLSICGNSIFFGCNDGSVYTINLDSTNTECLYKTCGNIKARCLVNESFIYFGSYDNYFYCFNIVDKSLKWKTKLEGSIAADPITEDFDTVYVGTLKGHCYSLKATNGLELWSHNLNEPIFGAACILDEFSVWPGVSGTVACLNSCGTVVWSLKADSNIFSSLKSLNNKLYFTCHDSFIYKITVPLSNTKLKISKIFQLDSECSSSPYLYSINNKTFLICVSNVGTFYIVNLQNNTTFKKQLPEECFSSPVVLNSKVYVGCRDNNLYCINIGKILNKWIIEDYWALVFFLVHRHSCVIHGVQKVNDNTERGDRPTHRLPEQHNIFFFTALHHLFLRNHKPVTKISTYLVKKKIKLNYFSVK